MPPGDAEAIAEAVNKLSQQPRMLSDWGVNARHWIEENGSKQAMERNIKALIELISSQRNSLGK